MKLRRVAYVLNVFPKLSETFIAYEMAELKRRGLDLRVCSLRPPPSGPRHRIVAEAGLDVLAHYEPGEFADLLAKFQPQLLHAHFATEPAAAARELAAAADLPFTFTAHGYDIRRKPPPDFAARAAAAAAVVTVSQANARHLVNTFAVEAKHVRVIPCGVDTARFKPTGSLGDAAGITSGGRAARRLIVCVARHAPVKNLGLLLEACAVLHARGVKFRCVSVGDGPCRAELVSKRDRLGLEGVVEFAGAADHEQVLSWWQRATVATLTSESEGMPVSLLEAAACAVPTVATAVGGVPELIEEGVTGLLTRPGDADGLASAWQSLLEDHTRAAEMGRAARRRVEERFSLARQVDQLMALWEELVA